MTAEEIEFREKELRFLCLKLAAEVSGPGCYTEELLANTTFILKIVFGAPDPEAE